MLKTPQQIHEEILNIVNRNSRAGDFHLVMKDELESFIHAIRESDREEVVRVVNELIKRNELTEKWSDDYYHALHDVISTLGVTNK